MVDDEIFHVACGDPCRRPFVQCLQFLLQQPVIRFILYRVWIGFPDRLIGVFRQLGGHLLDPVFAQGVNTGGNGLLAGGGVVHFAGAHQDDVGAGAAGLPGRLVHLLPDGGNILRNRHSESLPFPY